MKITIEKEHNTSFREKIIPLLEKNKTKDLYIHYPKDISYKEVTFYDTFLYLYSKLNIIIHLVGFPLCVLPSRDYALFLKKYDGEFVSECKNCKEKNNCFGIPKDYLRKFGEKEIKPFIQNDYTLINDWRKDKKKITKMWDLEKERQQVIWDNYFKDVKGKILNVGAGIGVFLSFDKNRIIGIDADENKVKNSLGKKGLNLKIGDARKLDFKNNYFNAVYSNFVLEHLSLEDAKKAMEEIRRVLKPKGKLFIIVAGGAEGKSWNNVGHVSAFTKKKLEKLIQEINFKKYKVFNAMLIREYKGFNFSKSSQRKNFKETALCLIAEK